MADQKPVRAPTLPHKLAIFLASCMAVIFLLLMAGDRNGVTLDGLVFGAFLTGAIYAFFAGIAWVVSGLWRSL